MSELVLWDSCTIIDAIQKKQGVYEYLEPQIRRGEAGDLFIVTSTISISEVTYCKDLAANNLSQEEQNKLIEGWFNNTYIAMRNADRGTCEMAANLGRQFSDKNGVLTPLDSIILATALKHHVETLVTLDDGVGSRNIGLLSLDGKIGNPPLKIKRPEDCEKQPSLI